MNHHLRVSVARFAAMLTIVAGSISDPANAALPPALAAAYAKDIMQPTCVGALTKDGEQHEVTLATGERIFLVRGACGCGASNCKVGVYTAQGDGYRSLLLNIAQQFVAKPDGTLVMTSEDDAWESERSSYRWNGNAYAIVSEVRVFGKYTKPVAEPVQFAAGASSATVSGTKVTQHFPDAFKFGAAKGQTLTLTFLQHDPKVNEVYVSRFNGRSDGTILSPTQSGDSYTVTLPSSGDYLLEIYGADETFRSYTMTIAIK